MHVISTTLIWAYHVVAVIRRLAFYREICNHHTELQHVRNASPVPLK